MIIKSVYIFLFQFSIRSSPKTTVALCSVLDQVCVPLLCQFPRRTHRVDMGADESKAAANSSGSPSYASGAIDFPNACRRESDATAWTLLHQCNLDKWKDGHAGELCLNPLLL